MPRIKIVFCWSSISGYMASCWKALARRPELDVHVIVYGDDTSPFSSTLLEGVSYRLLARAERHDATLITRLIAERKPDVVAITGWWLSAYRAQLRAKELQSCRFIMGVDSPWRHEGQYLTRLRYCRTLSRVDHFFVPGERAWQYVSRLGIAPFRISRGMYGIDNEALREAARTRAAEPWPKRFLFLGRYAPEKSIDVLVAAYAKYRKRTTDPWELVCCGSGPLGKLLVGKTGIRDLGFVDPRLLSEVLASAGAFVLPSRFDPWPLALVEAAASGLPVVCTDACGSAVEIVRPLYNGIVVPTECSEALADAMAAATNRYLLMPVWGMRSSELAAAYAAELWADRWLDRIRRLALAR
jgi:glycosyltransferase involved in cell wall biosynthesis